MLNHENIWGRDNIWDPGTEEALLTISRSLVCLVQNLARANKGAEIYEVHNLVIPYLLRQGPTCGFEMTKA